MKINSPTPKEHFFKANEHYKNKEYSNAEREYRSAIEKDPSFSEAHYNLANLLLELNRKEEAEDEYRRVLDIDSDFVEAIINLGILLFIKRKYNESKNLLSKAIEIKPDDVLIRKYLEKVSSIPPTEGVPPRRFPAWAKWIIGLVILVVTIIMLRAIISKIGPSTQPYLSPVEEVAKAPEEYVGEITLWHFNDEFENFMLPMFSEIYPNLTVNATKIPMGELITKLESAFAAGTFVPDVFVGEQSWVKKMVQYDVWENISAAPYNAEEAAADQYDYCKDLARDADGNLVALSYQAYPGGVFYRRSMAQETLGVSEPEDVAALMTNMDDFLEMGRKLKDAGYCDSDSKFR